MATKRPKRGSSMEASHNRSSARAYRASTISVLEPSAMKMRSDMSNSPVEIQAGIKALQVRLRLGMGWEGIKKI
jgi:hypothetical protein